MCGEEGVDTDRIGLLGTSYSGGHVIYVAAQDDRVAAIYSQVSYQGNEKNIRKNFYRQRATKKARGIIDPIPQGVDVISKLLSSPDLAKC